MGPVHMGRGPRDREKKRVLALCNSTVGLKSRRLLPPLCRCAAASASVGLVYYKQGLSVAAKGKSRWERDAETASCSR
jgi:hypothetical protein